MTRVFASLPRVRVAQNAESSEFQNYGKAIEMELVEGLPKISVQKDEICEACQQEKQIKLTFQSKKILSTNRELELLHMDLSRPMRKYMLLHGK